MIERLADLGHDMTDENEGLSVISIILRLARRAVSNLIAFA